MLDVDQVLDASYFDIGCAGEAQDRIDRLPPHRDVVSSLELLQKAGLRLAALSNGTLGGVRAQIEHAGLTHFFEEIFSAHEVERFKPASELYRMAARRHEVEPDEVRMVAGHAWDIAGAHAAGLETAFVRRQGKILNPLGPEPGIHGADLVGVAEEIVREDG